MRNYMESASFGDAGISGVEPVARKPWDGSRPSAAGLQVAGVDLLRFLAASLVMVYHIAFVSWAAPMARGSSHPAAFLVYKPIAPLVSVGWIGVQIFFVISGFVIALSANGKSPAAFLKSRVLRLVPGVWICATLSVPLLLIAGEHIGSVAVRYAASLIFYPSPPWVASSYWTLPIEIMFYSLTFLLLMVDRFRLVERMALVLGGLSTMLWLSVALASAASADRLSDHIVGFAQSRVAALMLLEHGCFFAMGIMIWTIRARGPSAMRVSATFLFGMAGIVQIVAESHASSAWTHYHELVALPVLLWIGAMLFLLVSVFMNERVAHALHGRARILRTIGLATYPLYLLHQPLAGPMTLYLLEQGWPSAIALVMPLTMSILAACVIATMIEPRLRAAMAAQWLRLSQIVPPHFARLSLPTTAIG